MITLGMFWRTAFLVAAAVFAFGEAGGGPSSPAPRVMQPIFIRAPADVYVKPRAPVPLLVTHPAGAALLPALETPAKVEDCGEPTKPMPRPLRSIHGHPRIWTWECADGWRWHESGGK